MQEEAEDVGVEFGEDLWAEGGAKGNVRKRILL